VRESPRIGVFICHCGSNIAGVVGVADVAEYAKGLPGVVVSEHNMYTCSADTLLQQKAKELDAAGILRKPVQLEALLELIRRVCRRSSDAVA
jgi:heterodisulfide reductase subunit A-like polyferredoxin